MEKIRVLVVDDSFFMRKVISDILDGSPEIEVVGHASDGLQALEKIPELKPKVVTLDLMMPNMNGLTTLQEIMKRFEDPPAVVIVSGYAEEQSGGVTLALRALEAGAIDYISKPSGSLSLDMSKVQNELISKIVAASKIDTAKVRKLSARVQKIASQAAKRVNSKRRVVVIGSSTGGPAALEFILPQIPVDFAVPILVAQHLPPRFTESFAKRLSKICKLQVKEGKDGEKVERGVIYIAPGSHDMKVVEGPGGEVVLSIIKNNQDGLTPSIDKLIQSAAKIYKDGTVGVVLTGMGNDGLLGMQVLKDSNGKTIVQDESTSVVYGMGKEVVDHGLADQVLPLDKITDAIIDSI